MMILSEKVRVPLSHFCTVWCVRIYTLLCVPEQVNALCPNTVICKKKKNLYTIYYFKILLISFVCEHRSPRHSVEVSKQFSGVTSLLSPMGAGEGTHCWAKTSAQVGNFIILIFKLFCTAPREGGLWALTGPWWGCLFLCTPFRCRTSDPGLLFTWRIFTVTLNLRWAFWNCKTKPFFPVLQSLLIKHCTNHRHGLWRKTSSLEGLGNKKKKNPQQNRTSIPN